MKGVMRFGKKGKLNPHYVVPYEILKRVGSVSYEWRFQNHLTMINLVFQVSMIKKCIGDPVGILPL